MANFLSIEHQGTKFRHLFMLIAVALICASVTWTLSYQQQSSSTKAFAETLSLQIAERTANAALAGDLLSIQGTLENTVDIDSVLGATVTEPDGNVLAEAGSIADASTAQHPIMVAGELMGYAMVGVESPSHLSSLMISVVTLLGLVSLFVGLSWLKPEIPTSRPNKYRSINGVVVTFELGDLPGLMDQLSTHTINNLYQSLEFEVLSLFKALGGELYLAQGPVLRAVFSGKDQVKSAAKAALMLKRMTHRWAENQGILINRRIAVQTCDDLPEKGDLINNHRRAQFNRHTGALLKSGQPGDIIFDEGFKPSLPNGTKVRPHPQFKVIAQFSPPLAHAIDLEVDRLLKQIAKSDDYEATH